MSEERKYFECTCDSPSHVIRVTYWKEENLIYIDYHLNPYQNIFKRLWNAIKYVFGTRSFEGHFDGTILRPDQILKFIEILEESLIVPEYYEIDTKAELKETERLIKMWKEMDKEKMVKLR